MGRELPPKIANAPTLLLGSDLWMDAFYELSSERQVGLMLGPIPWSSVRRWGQCFNLDEEQLEDLHWYMSRLDAAFLKHSATTGGGSGQKG